MGFDIGHIGKKGEGANSQNFGMETMRKNWVPSQQTAMFEKGR